MSILARLLWPSLAPFVLLVVPPTYLSAQRAGTDAIDPPAPLWRVAVTPDGTTTASHPVNTGPFLAAAFTVKNTGNQPDTYQLNCSGTNGITCQPLNPSSVSLAAGASTVVKVWASTGSLEGTGRLNLSALGEAEDIGFVFVPVTAESKAPVVSTAQHNGQYVHTAKCAGSCANVIWTHATPAYLSLGEPRGVPLAYNSGTARPVPVILLDLSSAVNHSPTTYMLEARLASNGALLTLLNGSQSVYYAVNPAATTRVAVALDATTNNLATGWHDLLITATSNYGTDSIGAKTVSVRLLVAAEAASPYGIGVQVVGLQRLFTQAGSNAVIITEGDGSVAFYARACSTCSFVTPAGSYASLTAGTTYRRTYIDGSYVEFNTAGLMTRKVDSFGNATTYSYVGTLLSAIQDAMGKSLLLGYSGGKLSSVTDPSGRSTAYTIPASGRLTRVMDPDGLFTDLTYTATGLLSSVTDRAGKVTNYTYDALSRLDTTISASVQIYTGATVRPKTVLASVERLVWSPAQAGTTAATAKPAVRADTAYSRLTDAAGSVARLAVDRFGAGTKMIDPQGKITTITRDTMSRPTSVSEPNGHARSYTYLSPSGLVQTYRDISSNRTITYTYSNNKVTTISGGPSRVDFFYHTGASGPAGALQHVYIGNTAVYPALGASAKRMATHHPDGRGRDTLVVDNANHKTRYLYDAVWGNVAAIVNELSFGSSWRYDNAGRPDTMIDAIGKRTVLQYDLLSRLRSRTDAIGGTSQLQYDPEGNLVRLVDAKGQVHKVAYNALGWLTARHDLADTTLAERFEYDATGNLRRATTRRNHVIDMAYDVMGRLTSRSGPGLPTDTYRYEPTGRWTVATNANGYDSLVFDPAGRLVQSFQKVNGTTFQWNYTLDIHDRITARAQPGGLYPAQWTYNSAYGDLEWITGAGARAQITRNAELLPTTVTHASPTPWTATRTFSGLHRTTSQTFSPASLQGFLGSTVTLDEFARVSGVKYGANAKRKFGYDYLGRLINSCDSVSTGCVNEFLSTTRVAFSYDATGNRLLESEPLTNVGPGNRINRTRNWYLTYDPSGNLLSRCLSTTSCAPGSRYTWDALDRLIATQGDGVNTFDATYAYDALGRRVAKTTGATTERYVYDREHVVLDLDGANAVKMEYAFHPGTDALFAARSPTWTGVALIDPSIGTVYGIAEYSAGRLIKNFNLTTPGAWGYVSPAPADSGSIVRYRMAGREFDRESGLYYMRSRYYEPLIGRFLSEDRLGLEGGVNQYAYARNDPVNSRDPNGTIGCIVITYTEQSYTPNGTSVPDMIVTTKTVIECFDSSDEWGGLGYQGATIPMLSRQVQLAWAKFFSDVVARSKSGGQAALKQGLKWSRYVCRPANLVSLCAAMSDVPEVVRSSVQGKPIPPGNMIPETHSLRPTHSDDLIKNIKKGRFPIARGGPPVPMLILVALPGIQSGVGFSDYLRIITGGVGLAPDGLEF